jgi:hypothetical protein
MSDLNNNVDTERIAVHIPNINTKTYTKYGITPSLHKYNEKQDKDAYAKWIREEVFTESGSIIRRDYMVLKIVAEIVNYSATRGFKYIYTIEELGNKYMQWLWRMVKEDLSILTQYDGIPNWVIPKLPDGHLNYDDYLEAFETVLTPSYCSEFMRRWGDKDNSMRLQDALITYFPKFFYSYLSMTESRTFRRIEAEHEEAAAAEEAEIAAIRGWDD